MTKVTCWDESTISGWSAEQVSKLKQEMHDWDHTSFTDDQYKRLISLYKTLKLENKIKIASVLLHYKNNLQKKQECIY
jgi:hypothetical protein